jgi:RNA polymerase-binding transcription factor DksA
MDQAQASEERDREFALRMMRLRIAESFRPRSGGVDGQCIDCENPIEPERMRALRVTSRCSSCAQDHEKRMKAGLNR